MAAKNSKDWIQKAGIRKGAFTEKAKKRGLTAAQFQAKVLKDPTKYDSTTVKQANLRKTLVSKKMKRQRMTPREKKLLNDALYIKSVSYTHLTLPTKVTV